MTDQPAPDSDALASSGVHHVEDVCDRFEAAWKGAAATAPPRLEDYLTAVPEREHVILLRELIALDIAYRCRRGEQPALQEYQLRFPGQAALVQAVFLTLSPPPAPADQGEPATPPRPRAGTPAGSDRNLLFGILALQMDFISREILIAAMHAWVLDKAKSLGQILVEQQALNPDEQAVLEALVQKHLQRHGNNPEQSLAALAAPAALAEELRSLNDGDLQASLDSMAHAGETDPAATIAHVPKAMGRPGDGLRYRILRPHAKGGLGEVFVAMDEELHREVALKEIQERYADDQQSQARFLQEAEITSGLEHPGIVPVHGLGRYADGRPFYAMRLIQGNSLKDAIQRFHKADGPARDPGERSFALHQLLRRFLDVCNAMAYAHSRGILHRDLKPANIMLGKYGETLVVDWGLAKSVGRPDLLPASGEVTLRPHSGGVAATQMGAALGTPTYMSPEQASGRLDLLGPASDVYSLGATLYTLLTGEAPFAGRDQGEILDKVRRGDFVPPRQAKEQTPAALASISLKAMALEPKERYATSLDLAADVEHWLADEPVGAWPEPWTARLRRWARRHKTVVAGLAGLLLTAVLALSISTAVIMRSQRQTEEHRQRAEYNFQKALGAVDRMLTRVGEKRLAGVPQMEEKRQEILEDALAFYKDFLQEASANPQIQQETGRAYQRTAHIHWLLGHRNEAQEAYNHGVELQTALVAQFPHSNDYRHDLAVTRLGLGDLLHAAGQNSAAGTSYDEARRLLDPWAGEPRTDAVYQKTLADILNNLGELYGETNRTEAEQVLLAAQALREGMVKSRPAVADYRQALALSHNSLGRLYINLGQKSKGEKAHEAALEIQKQLVRDQPAIPDYQIDLATTFIELGSLYRDDIRTKEAMAAFEKARTIWQKLTKDHPHVPDYQHGLAQFYITLGGEYVSDFHGGAGEVLENALKILKPLVDNHQEEIKFAVSLAIAYLQTGCLMKDTDRRRDALDMFSKSVQILKGVLAREPLHVEARKWLSYTHMFRAENLIRMGGRRQEAIEDWQQIVKLSQGQSDAQLRCVRAIARAHLGEHTQAEQEALDIIQQNLLPSATAGTYNCACVFSICSETVLSDPKLSPAARKKEAERYRDSAMKQLMTLRDAGFFGPAQVEALRRRRDPDLDPLRSCDDFKNLVHQLEEEEKKRKAKEK